MILKSYLFGEIYLFVVIENDNAKVVGTVGILDSDESFIKTEKTADIGQIAIGDATERGKRIGYHALLLAMCIGF